MSPSPIHSRKNCQIVPFLCSPTQAIHRVYCADLLPLESLERRDGCATSKRGAQKRQTKEYGCQGSNVGMSQQGTSAWTMDKSIAKAWEEIGRLNKGGEALQWCPCQQEGCHWCQRWLQGSCWRSSSCRMAIVWTTVIGDE